MPARAPRARSVGGRSSEMAPERPARRTTSPPACDPAILQSGCAQVTPKSLSDRRGHRRRLHRRMWRPEAAARNPPTRAADPSGANPGGTDKKQRARACLDCRQRPLARRLQKDDPRAIERLREKGCERGCRGHRNHRAPALPAAPLATFSHLSERDPRRAGRAAATVRAVITGRISLTPARRL
jgi:hypothetical protein